MTVYTSSCIFLIVVLKVILKTTILALQYCVVSSKKSFFIHCYIFEVICKSMWVERTIVYSCK